MKYISLLTIFLLACGNVPNIQSGPPGLSGESGKNGHDGRNGSSCSVQQTLIGALIQCSDGTTALILHGSIGATGYTGLNGLASPGLKGPTGAQGNAGSQGAKGDTGPTGATTKKIVIKVVVPKKHH